MISRCRLLDLYNTPDGLIRRRRVGAHEAERTEESMDIRERHFGYIAMFAGGLITGYEIDALIRRLLLFEHCILQSDVLNELPALVKVFGYHGVMRLLEEPTFEIICDVVAPLPIGPQLFRYWSVPTPPELRHELPLGSHRIALVRSSGSNGRELFESVRNIPTLSAAERADLERALVAKIITFPSDAGLAGERDYFTDLQAGDVKVRSVVRHVVRTVVGIDVGNTLRVEVEAVPSDRLVYRVQTNLQSDFGLDEQVAHNIVDRALLGIAGLNIRLSLMATLNAVTSFEEDEVSVFESRLRFITDQVDPSIQEQRFERVTTLADLPTVTALGDGAAVDMDKLLRLRSHRDCVDLRRWLRSTDGQSDRDIEQQFMSVKEKLAGLTHSRTGRVVRFLTTSGIGAIPVAGAVLGPASTLADQFIADKLIGAPGPVCFLSHQYRSIFQ